MIVNVNKEWMNRVFSEAAVAAGTHRAPLFEGNRLSVVHEDGPGDTKVRRCAAGGPLRLGEKVYEHGIGVNSHSVLRVTLTESAKVFRADIGLDRNVDNTPASVRFHVATGGADVFATDVMRPADGVRTIEVPLRGAKEFDLIVDVGGDDRSFDQADWGDARVELETGAVVWLDDLAAAFNPLCALPFSFVYDGKPSAELLPQWKCDVQQQKPDDTTERRTLTLTDPQTGLEVRAVVTAYTDSPGVDWTVWFTNRGTQDSPVLEQVNALDVAMLPGLGSRPVMHRVHGGACTAEDWLPFDEPAPDGKRIEFGPSNGRASAVSPFFNLDLGGGGVVTGIGWSGQWAASVESGPGGLRLQAGQHTLRVKLHPGESIRTPRIMQLYWTGDDPNRPYNLWRRTMLAHIAPKVRGATAVPPITHLSTSFYELNASTESNVLSHLDSIKGLGFEVFWLDAYWTRDGFPNGMGHYGFPIQRAEPPDRFPNGLKPIRDAVHEAGMEFLMWFEPERVAPGTAIAKEHPEWVISPNNDGSGLFHLGIPEAREYMTEYLKTVIREYGLGWLRIDYNIDPLPFWQFLNGKDPDRAGIGEVRYVEGLYRMWDDLRAAYPDLRIDNCASGGQRIDLETCSRSIPLWRTDATIGPLMEHNFNQAALQNQVMTAGLSRYVPFSTSGEMGATPYLFRSGFNAGIAFCEDCRPKDYPRDQLKQAIAEAKRIRKYYSGDFYPLAETTTSPRDWCVLQYHLPKEHEGMVIAFRRHASPYAAFACELHAIDPQAHYDLTLCPGYETPAPIRMKGSDLQTIRAEIPERPGSLIIEYKQLPQQ